MAAKRVFDIVFRTKGTDRLKNAVTGVGRGLAGLTKGAALAGAGVAALSVKLAGDFSKRLAEVSTLMDNTSEKSIKQMGKELRLLSQTSGLALSSLSKAKYDVVSAGFAGAAESAQILATSTQLAVGGVTSAASAADLLTTSLNAYGLSANQVNDVSDTLFTTVKLGKTTMDELAGSLGKVLPIAKSAGVSFQAVGATMATLTAGGINTAESTTALRGAIIALTAPVGAAAEAMSEAGIETKRFDDGSLDLVGTLEQFQGMDPNTLRKFIPDINAMNAISALADNVDGLSENLLDFEKRTGATETAFNKMAGEFNTQMGMLKNAAQSVMIEIGDVIIEAILPSIKNANKTLATLGEIGWDEVASRLVENMDSIKNIAVQSFEILGAELGIIGQKMIRILPGFLGGSDKKANENIEQYEREIRNRLDTIKFELNLLATEVSKPLPEPPVTPPSLDDIEAPKLTIRTEAIESVDLYDEKLGQVRTTVTDLDQSMIQQVNTAGLLSGALQTAFDPDLGAGEAFKGLVLQILSAMQGVILASKAVSEALTFTFAGPVGVGVALASLAALEVAKAGVRSIKFAQFGMDEMVSQPTLIMAGEAGPERVSITPASRPSSEKSDSGGMTINFLGPVTDKEFVRDTIIPEIQKVAKLGLA